MFVLPLKRLTPVLVLVFVAPVHGAVITAASCSQASVASALASARPGDTVRVPAGTCSWSPGITVNGVQLIGAGKSATTGTVITAGLATLTKHSSYYTRLSGFRFTGTDPHIIANGSQSARPYVIDNNYLRMDVSGLALHLNANGGLLHHNEMTALTATNLDVMVTRMTNDSGWAEAATFGNQDTTGERNLYIEDNTFTGVLETLPDGDTGSRLVIRYNNYVDTSIVFHSSAPVDSGDNSGGTRQFEIYNNTFSRVSNAVGVNKWVWVRGGTGVIANNVMARADSPDGSSYPNKSEIRLSLACPGAYPLQYQVGQSTPTPATPPTRPLLIFGNTGPGTLDANFISVNSSDTAGGSCGSPGTYIQQGRDYMLSNTWGWVPYTYPHPLQSLGSGASVGSPPPPPANLRVSP